MTKQLLALHSCLRVWACVWRKSVDRNRSLWSLFRCDPCFAVPSFNSWMRRVKAGAFFLSKDATCTISSCVTIPLMLSPGDTAEATFTLPFSNIIRNWIFQTTEGDSVTNQQPIVYKLRFVTQFVCALTTQTTHTTASISASTIDWHMTFSIRV